MAKFRDILTYYDRYRAVIIFSIAAASIFEIIDLIVPYATGQILNVLSGQPVDRVMENAIAAVANITQLPQNRFLSLAVLMGLIFLVTVVRAPIQMWSAWWYHWYIALRSRQDHFKKTVAKILTLPLEFYDENNPGRIAGKISKGIENHTWTYPEVAGQLIPKLFRVLGIFVVILLIEWRIALLFLLSFVVILSFTLKDLKQLTEQERRLDKYMENTQSRNSEIITNIKTVESFCHRTTRTETAKTKVKPRV
ncbi:ABC transporter transmembrane domain-containing protein [Scytonema sp. PRP1]